jgi:hypothetical protein
MSVYDIATLIHDVAFQFRATHNPEGLALVLQMATALFADEKVNKIRYQ